MKRAAPLCSKVSSSYTDEFNERWSLKRRQKYFDWAKEVVDQAHGVNPRLERMFDRLYRQRPVS